MLNKVQLIGRLGQDTEMRQTSTGGAICIFSIATSERYTDKFGEKQEKTEWHNIVCFEKTAENCSKFIGKGSLVYIEGKLKTDKWQDKNGNDRLTTKIHAQYVQFLDRKNNTYEQQQTHDYNSFIPPQNHDTFNFPQCTESQQTDVDDPFDYYNLN